MGNEEKGKLIIKKRETNKPITLENNQSEKDGRKKTCGDRKKENIPQVLRPVEDRCRLGRKGRRQTVLEDAGR